MTCFRCEMNLEDFWGHSNHLNTFIHNLSINCLWNIQKIHSLGSISCAYSKSFRIKLILNKFNE